MPQLLPAIANRADFARVRDQPVDDWRPALQALAARHGFADGHAERFGSGQVPVFAVGRQFVVKLVPHFWTQIIQREAECLRFLAGKTGLPKARIVADGALDDWHYLVSSRLPGEQLSEVWPRLNPGEKADLAGKLGESLRELHRIPLGGFRPGGIEWAQFFGDSVATWEKRKDLAGLPVHLRNDGPRFLAFAGAQIAAAPLVLLHGDLAPENLLVERDAKGWKISGVLDFGNALAGSPLFDLTAPSVLLDPGHPDIVARFLTGYGGPDAPGAQTLRLPLMALTLIHQMADLPECLSLVVGAANCRTWEAVAERFWPDCPAEKRLIG
jgi:hygromycin-B 7''-O-kinase